ncbi:ER membrane glycoprotein subunit of the GPI transamidase complex-like protein [Ceratocystis pirilliformis]|uniref:GPI mannosyltransferase 2 n=1 Tax=Ceratocystis pirilliformis TaxID=259994 RepID=A0ABR3ZNY1_9PEZI
MAKPSTNRVPSGTTTAKTATNRPAKKSDIAPIPLGFIFTLWKTLLLLIAFGSAIGPSYDTSTEILFDSAAANHVPENDGDAPLHSTIALLFDSKPSLFRTLVIRLTRWDALYFVKAAQRGRLYEQEWAFGIGQPALVSTLLQGCKSIAIELGLHADAVTAAMGVAIAIYAHLYAVHALYALVELISGSKRQAYVAGLLHVFSPAGLFLAAPYAEAPFAYLTFTGLLCYARGLTMQRGSWGRVKRTLWSGLLLGLATMCRSNGISYGIVFAIDLADGLRELFGQESGIVYAPKLVVSLATTVLGGVFVGLGSLLPQIAAYIEFCGRQGAEPREWCTNLVPSIYSYVQKRYWNVGFLRYWTPGNIPLFALAMPMLYILCASSKVSLLGGPTPSQAPAVASMVRPGPKSPYASLIQSLAISQAILAILAFTSYHVQIITRISSGYPLWYVWVAEQLAATSDQGKVLVGRRIVVYMVVYALIQGVLYASFLPPA